MSELGPNARALFDAAAVEDQPRDADRDRVEAALMASIAAGVTASTVTASAAADTIAGGAGATGSAFGFGKILATLALVGGVGAGGYAAMSHDDSVRPPDARVELVAAEPVASTSVDSPAEPPAPERPAETASPPEPSPQPEPRPTRRARVSPRDVPVERPGEAEEAESPAVPPGLADELRLIRSANAATRSGAPARALAILAEHRARYPRGELSSERDAMRVEALCAAGRREQGEAEAEAFATRYPGSPLRARVLAACR